MWWICAKDRMLRSASSPSGLSFRHSAFRSDEPKVSRLAPSLLGFVDASLAIFVFGQHGHSTPHCNVDHRMRTTGTKMGLFLLVRRWAMDRAVCHAAKVHLSPCTWTLLTIFFLQIDVEVEAAVPPS